MCIPHGMNITKDNGYIEDKPKKHVKMVSQKEFEKGDPDFIDERISKYTKPKKSKSFFDSIFGK